MAPNSGSKSSNKWINGVESEVPVVPEYESWFFRSKSALNPLVNESANLVLDQGINGNGLSFLDDVVFLIPQIDDIGSCGPGDWPHRWYAPKGLDSLYILLASDACSNSIYDHI
jgi:hypothetical protein